MSSLKAELDEYKAKYLALREEWGLQQEHLGRQQDEAAKVRGQLKEQSEYCAALGSTLGHLLWKASRTPDVVNVLVAGNKMPDFLCTVKGTLTSFMETYGGEFPAQGADESQFVMSLVGIVTNIAASAEGRDFLIDNHYGKSVIDYFIKCIGDIPVPTGNCLKRLIYMCLYNLSINYKGGIYLQGQIPLLKSVGETLENHREGKDLQYMAIKLMQSLTSDIEYPATLDTMSELVPAYKINTFLSDSDQELKDAAKAIIENYNSAKLKFEENKKDERLISQDFAK